MTKGAPIGAPFVSRDQRNCYMPPSAVPDRLVPVRFESVQ